MSYCPKCGEEISSTYNFCPSCGRNLNTNIDLEDLRVDLEKEYDDYMFQDELKEYPKGKFCTTDYVTTGGYRGGSCWNNDKPEYRKTGNTPNFDNIIKILKKYGIPEEKSSYHLSRMKISLETSEYEYYGNSSEYEKYVFDIDMILNFVAENY